jgi:hypothetical protein
MLGKLPVIFVLCLPDLGLPAPANRPSRQPTADSRQPTSHVLYVDDDAPPPAGGDGTSWPNAFRCLQDALAYAADPAHGITEIHIAGGRYQPDRSAGNPDGTRDRAASFTFINNVAVMGGYLGLSAQPGEDPDTRDLTKHETILDGDLNGDDGPPPETSNKADNSYHVAIAIEKDINATAIYDGVTLAGGYSDGPGFGATPESKDQGSGLNVYHAAPTLLNCTFRDNWAANHGALNDHGACTLINCTFRDNRSVLIGAGLYIHHHSPTVAIGCQFINNSCEGEGGGAYSRSAHNPDAGDAKMTGPATLIDCAFEGNAAINGAGMYNAPGSGTIILNCTFTNNVASGSGGGMYNNGSSAMVMGCTFRNNAVAGAGGGYYCNNCNDAMVLDSHFADNLSVAGGGGIWNAGGTASIDQCTFVNNTGFSGGGIYLGDHGYFTVTHCTLIENHAGEGGGISNADTGGHISHCTLVRNDALMGAFPVGGGMQNYISSVRVDHCAFTGNLAALGGGGVYNEAEYPFMTHCTFHANAALDDDHGWGGGMLNGYYTHATIANCAFVGNTARQGGAVHNMTFSESAVVNCTLVGNVADALNNWNNFGGGGCAAFQDSSATIINSIVWGNVPDQFAGAPVDVSFCCVEGGYGLPTDGNISDNPLLSRLPSAGADDTWGTDDDDYGDLHLMRRSPCIDRGDDTAVPWSVTTDLDDRPRFADDPSSPDLGNPSDYHAIVDLGALEFQDASCRADVAPYSRSAQGDGVVNIDDLWFIILRWGELGRSPADIAPDGGDGVVNWFDLQAVIDGWGPCP